MTRLLIAAGFACTPEIWSAAEALLVGTESVHAQWHTGLHTVSAARDHLAITIASTEPDAYIGHSLGGLLLLELLASQRIASRPSSREAGVSPRSGQAW